MYYKALKTGDGPWKMDETNPVDWMYPIQVRVTWEKEGRFRAVFRVEEPGIAA